MICLTDDIYVFRLVSGVFLIIILKKDENKEFQSQYLCKPVPCLLHQEKMTVVRTLKKCIDAYGRLF